MNELFFAESSAWLTQVGLAGTPEPEIVFGFCERCLAAGLPVARGLVAIGKKWIDRAQPRVTVN